MKAAVLKNILEPLYINDKVKIPNLKDGQVLVKIIYSGVCCSQLMEAKGYRGEDKFLPHMLGHEGTGIVIDIGSGVTKVKPGDKIILSWIKGKGIDAGGTVYQSESGLINAGAVTTFSEYSVVSENRCFILPDDIPMDIGALFGCAIPTGCGIIINEINPQKNTSIAIFGLGGIGTCALMAASLYDLKHIIAVDISEEKLKKARGFGATQTINALHEDSTSIIMNLTNGNGADYSVDASGVIDSIETAFSVVKKGGGLCIIASHPKSGDKIQIEPHDLIAGKQIRGSWGGGCKPDTDIPKFAELYKKGRLPLNELLDESYSIDEINTALYNLEKGKITRALIKF